MRTLHFVYRLSVGSPLMATTVSDIPFSQIPQQNAETGKNQTTSGIYAFSPSDYPYTVPF